MTTLWVTLAIAVVLLAGLLAYAGWRDRRRLSSADDGAAGRAAAADAHRHAAESHGRQGANRIRDQNSSP